MSIISARILISRITEEARELTLLLTQIDSHLGIVRLLVVRRRIHKM